MSLLVAEGFDDVSSQTTLGESQPYQGKDYWGGASCSHYENYYGRTAGRYHGYAKIFAGTLGNTYCRWDIPSDPAELYMAFAIRRTGNSASESYFLAFEDFGVNYQVVLSMAGTQGQDLKVYRGNGITQLGTTSSNVFPLNTWVWLSIRVVVNNTTGLVEIKDGVGTTVFTVSGVDTQQTANARITHVLVSSLLTSNHNRDVDDVLIMNTTDSPSGTPFKGHLTERAIWTGIPDADGANSDWTAQGAANRWQCLDEVPMDEDTTYIYSGTATDKNTSSLASRPAGMAGIDAMFEQFRARKDDAGARTVRALLRSGGTNYNGDTFTMGASYKTFASSPREVDPFTSAAIDANDINSMESGVEVVS